MCLERALDPPPSSRRRAVPPAVGQHGQHRGGVREQRVHGRQPVQRRYHGLLGGVGGLGLLRPALGSQRRRRRRQRGLRQQQRPAAFEVFFERDPDPRGTLKEQQGKGNRISRVVELASPSLPLRAFLGFPLGVCFASAFSGLSLTGSPGIHHFSFCDFSGISTTSNTCVCSVASFTALFSLPLNDMLLIKCFNNSTRLRMNDSKAK